MEVESLKFFANTAQEIQQRVDIIMLKDKDDSNKLELEDEKFKRKNKTNNEKLFDREFVVPTDGSLDDRKNELRQLVKSECQNCLEAAQMEAANVAKTAEEGGQSMVDVNADDGSNVKGIKNKVMDVVLLFDEAQHLLTENDDAFLFRVLRWIIRKKKHFKIGIVKFRITVAAAGTNSKLADFFPEKEEKKSNATSSRYLKDEPSEQYYNYPSDAKTHEQFQPYFILRTQGCLSERYDDDPSSHLSSGQDDSPEQTEYQRMIRFSRPLFALLYNRKMLDSDVEFDIAKKIILGKTTSWTDDRRSCLSVLATRVQMGATSTSVVSDLVSRGYAHLTFFQNKSDQDSDIPSLASFAFLPDPVCARIAMCLMDEHHTFHKEAKIASPRNNKRTIEGARKTSLVIKMKDIFPGGMCLPAKGDVGEVAVALYLLFCGDILREEYNEGLFDRERHYHQLGVDYIRWMKTLWNRGNLPEKDCLKSELHINCILFFRYSFPKSMSELADQLFLKSLFEKGCAIYCFTNTEAVDLLIACFDAKTSKYIPIFISVKNYGYLSPADGNNFLQSSFETLKKAGVTNGLLLLVIAGQDREVVDCSTYEEKWDTENVLLTRESSANDMAKIREELRAGFLCLHGDKFAINDMLNDLSMVKRMQISEVYGMHGELIHVQQKSGKLPSSYRKSTEKFFKETLGCVKVNQPEAVSGGDGER